MKFNFNYIALLAAVVFFTACGNDFETEEFYDLEELPGYVSFVDGTTNNATIDTAFVAEDAGSVTFTIATPTGTLSDINITYDISGSAVAGTDYNIANAGSITLATDPEDFQDRDQVDLAIEILTDDVTDGEKTLTITLTGASNSEGSMAVGRGGTDFLKSATVVIGDID